MSNLAIWRGRGALMVCVGLATGLAQAGIAPENVAVVVNGESWASLTVANEYARLRHIPASNFIVLGGVSQTEVIGVDEFRTQILLPVFGTLKQRGIEGQIDCIVYSCDLPHAVDVGRDMAGKQFSQVITGVASINGLTYLHELVEKKDTAYLTLNINRYMRRTLPVVSVRPLSAEGQAQYTRGVKLYDAKKWDEAAAAMGPVAAMKSGDPNISYNLACCLSLGGKLDSAVAALKQAFEEGWRNYGHTSADPDLKPLAERADFKELLAKMKSSPVEVQPTRGFRSKYAWSEAGEPASQGPRYVLSTVLGVTTGRGNSVNEVLESLRRAAAADGDSPKGTVYLPKNGDVRSATREWAFAAAAAELKKLGVNAVVEDGVLPKSKKDVAGAVIGTADFEWPGSQSTILPGAICEHLTSLGGIISERGGQTACTEFIRAGAAGTSGTVTEPYALQEKFPTAFMHVHYARGSTLAEAFYQAVYGPYQLLIIGDPLCRPWGRPVRAAVGGLTPGATVKGTVELKPGAGTSIESHELYVDGKLIATAKGTEPLKLDTAAVGDGSRVVSVVAVQKDAIEARGRTEAVVTVANQGRKVELTGMAPARAKFGEKVKVELVCVGAETIEMMHLGRVVGSCEGGSGVIDIDTRQLGLGRTALRPVGRGKAGEVMGAIIEVDVEPPAPISPKPARTGAKVEKGLALSVGGVAAAPVDDTISGDWLSSRAPEGKSYMLTGYFDAPKADLYQLCVRTNTGAEVEISGVKVLTASDGSWQRVPVPLKPGSHRFEVKGTAPKGAQLEIRFGAGGAFRPSAERFTRVAP